jgi:two-component system response regulator NreC
MTGLKIRILIADDHAVLRAGVRMLLTAQSDLVVVAEAADGTETVAQVRDQRPDVLLLDLSMPGPSTNEVIREVLRVSPSTRVLVLTMHDDPAYLASAMLAGAAGYVVKKVADTELLQAIRAVHGGRTFVDLTRSSDPHQRPAEGTYTAAEGAPKDLSRREVEVLRLLAQGHSNQQVADRIQVSVKTVETYRTRLSDKLGLKGRSELYRFAVESGILDTGM